MFKVNYKDTRSTSMTSFWCLYRQLWTYFTLSSNVSIVNFEHVNTDWAADVTSPLNVLLTIHLNF